MEKLRYVLPEFFLPVIIICSDRFFIRDKFAKLKSHTKRGLKRERPAHVGLTGAYIYLLQGHKSGLTRTLKKSEKRFFGNNSNAVLV